MGQEATIRLSYRAPVTKIPTELVDLIRRYEPDVQTTAIAMRSVVLEEIGPCHETVFEVYRNNVISILYSTTEKRMKDNVCLVVVYKDHVNLMFPRGVDLKDPKRLLEGAGKAMRHVKMRSPADTDRPGVRQLIKQARNRRDLGKPAEPLKTVVTMLKAKRVEKTASAWPRLF
jgi:hypothetical protein